MSASHEFSKIMRVWFTDVGEKVSRKKKPVGKKVSRKKSEPEKKSAGKNASEEGNRKAIDTSSKFLFRILILICVHSKFFFLHCDFHLR